MLFPSNSTSTANSTLVRYLWWIKDGHDFLTLLFFRIWADYATSLTNRMWWKWSCANRSGPRPSWLTASRAHFLQHWLLEASHHVRSVITPRPPHSKKSNKDKGPAGWDAVHKKERPRATQVPDLWVKSHPERDTSRPRRLAEATWIRDEPHSWIQIPDLGNCEQNKCLLVIFESFLSEVISDLEKNCQNSTKSFCISFAMLMPYITTE